MEVFLAHFRNFLQEVLANLFMAMADSTCVCVWVGEYV